MLLHHSSKSADVLTQPDPELPRFVINPALDRDALARTFRNTGRLRIANFLSEGALPMLQSLWKREDSIHVVSAPGGALEFDAAAKAALSEEEWSTIERDAYLRARTEFQYRYELLAVPSRIDADDPTEPLDLFAQFMASASTQDFLCAVTGETGALDFSDGQATAYGCGDFLTRHDDDVAGKSRIAAFVCGLTPVWQLDWGGLLLFHEDEGDTTFGLVPKFNTLDLFAVPRLHSVSAVTAAAPHRRFAITGWLSERV